MKLSNVAVIGCTGAMGGAFTQCLSGLHPGTRVCAFSRSIPDRPIDGVRYEVLDYNDETSIAAAASAAAETEPFDLIIVATGMLHQEGMMPEKSLKALSADKFHHLFAVNTVIPALLAKHFLPCLNTKGLARFAVLSARVGSISDNRAGGWYAYRASKAALNMVIKTAAIEMQRRHKQAIVVGLHPGTVDSQLSLPFQANVPESKLFTAHYAASKLLAVLAQLTPADSGRCFAWDGKEVLP